MSPPQQAQALGGAVAGDAGVPPAVAASPETRLALVRALIATGDLNAAQARLAELPAGQADWRATWYGGLCALAGGRPDQARTAFSAVYDELPGELAPKLALGFAAEAAGDMAAARYYFGLVWTIDRSYVSAGFGTARACLAGGDRIAAIAAIAAVPETSSHHAAAQIAAVRLLVAGGTGRSEDDLRQADFRLGRLSLDDNDPRRHQLAVEILRAALDWVSAAPPAAGGTARHRPPASSSSAASRTSGRCASGSSAATARSPTWYPSGESNWWTWRTASGQGRGFETAVPGRQESTMTGLPGFTVDIDQNPYLPVGGAMSARSSPSPRTRRAAGPAAVAPDGGSAEIVIIDCSGSMDYPPAKIAEARAATAAAVDVIRDGTWFAIVAGTSTAWPVYPPDGSMAVAGERTRAEAKAALRQLRASGGTAIGQWLRLANQVFQGSPATLRHAILLTDGKNQHEKAEELAAAISLCEGTFRCDCRGVGTDWEVSELRKISTALLGSVDIVVDPAGLAADFEELMRGAMSKHLPDVALRVWTPQTAAVKFVKQVAPAIDDLTEPPPGVGRAGRRLPDRRVGAGGEPRLPRGRHGEPGEPGPGDARRAGQPGRHLRREPGGRGARPGADQGDLDR